MVSTRGLCLLGLLLIVISPIGCEHPPAPTATEQATQQPRPTVTSPPPSPSPTPTLEPAVGRESLVAGEDWAFYEGDVPPFKAYQAARGRMVMLNRSMAKCAMNC